jgi:hypothetical protein
MQLLQVPSNDTPVIMFHLPDWLCRWLDSHEAPARPRFGKVKYDKGCQLDFPISRITKSGCTRV